MERKRKILAGDTVLWVIFFFLSIISLVAVYSTIGRTSSAPSSAFFKHLAFVLCSYAVVVVSTCINYRKLSKLVKIGFWLSIALLVCALFFGESGRWIPIVGDVKFQPSEIAKIMVVLYLAYQMAVCKDSISEQGTFYKLLIPIVLVCGLVVSKNLSMALLIFMVGYLMLFFGGVNKSLWWKGFGIMLAVAVVGFFVLYLLGEELDVARSSIWGERLEAWLYPDPDKLTQENLARMAIARGGMFGKGIGTTVIGRLMTQSECDFIFAIIVEEVGLIPSLLIPVLYAAFYYRCIHIASETKGLFGSMSVAGIGTMITIQAFLNMAVATGVLPVTGQNLPFISHGGTSYLFLSVGLGFIQSVAAYNKRVRRAEAKAEVIAQETDKNNETKVNTI